MHQYNLAFILHTLEITVDIFWIASNEQQKLCSYQETDNSDNFDNYVSTISTNKYAEKTVLKYLKI